MKSESAVIQPSSTVLRAAKKESGKSAYKFKHSSIIYKGRNRILVKAHNKIKTDPRFGSGDYCTLHSEGAAIKKALKLGIDIKGAKMYNYRERGNLSKPCPCCQNLIDKYNIIVHYSK